LTVNTIGIKPIKNVPYSPCPPHGARFQLGQGLRQDNFLPKAPEHKMAEVTTALTSSTTGPLAVKMTCPEKG